MPILLGTPKLGLHTVMGMPVGRCLLRQLVSAVEFGSPIYLSEGSRWVDA